MPIPTPVDPKCPGQHRPGPYGQNRWSFDSQLTRCDRLIASRHPPEYASSLGVGVWDLLFDLCVGLPVSGGKVILLTEFAFAKIRCFQGPLLPRSASGIPLTMPTHWTQTSSLPQPLERVGNWPEMTKTTGALQILNFEFCAINLDQLMGL